MKIASRKYLVRGVLALGFLAGSVALAGAALQPAVAQTAAPAPAAAAAAPAGPSAYQRQMEREQALHPILPIGAAMPAFSLKNTDGSMMTPATFKDADILVVAFLSNHCPASQNYETRITKLQQDYAAKGVKVIAIQPDGPKASAMSEMNFTPLDDSYESMVKHAAFRKFNFPYLYDGDDQVAAHAFGPKVTPHIFIFDKARKLRFEGRIDDAMREANVKTRDTRNAIDALLEGKPVPVEKTPVFGCSTKWNSPERFEVVERQVKAWDAKPVTLETISLANLKKLRETPPGKFVMINFWATWCGPCLTEFPDMVQTHQWYQSRNFELVTVSVDAPDAKDNVKRLLTEHKSAVRNYQVDTDDVFAVQAAFEESWQSGVPYTIVIAPDGKVIYRKEGENDILAMRRTILANLDDRGNFAGNADYWKQ